MKRAKLCTAFALILAAVQPLCAQIKMPAPQAQSLPQDMLGSWARDETDCMDRESESRLHITARALEFAGSRLTISRTISQKDGWWRVEGLSKEEGKRRAQRASMDFKLKSKDELMMRNGPEKPEDFVRCKPAQLQG